LPILRLFASARDAAGVAKDEIQASTVGALLVIARDRYGPEFTAVLATARVWVNGQPAEDSTAIGARDVVAILPPVSGGAPPPIATREAPPRPVDSRSEQPLPPPRAAPPPRTPPGSSQPPPEARRPPGALPEGAQLAKGPPPRPRPPSGPRPSHPAGVPTPASSQVVKSRPSDGPSVPASAPPPTPAASEPQTSRSPNRPVLASHPAAKPRLITAPPPPPPPAAPRPTPGQAKTTATAVTPVRPPIRQPSPSTASALSTESSEGAEVVPSASPSGSIRVKPSRAGRGWLGLGWVVASAAAVISGPELLAVWFATGAAASAAQVASVGVPGRRKPALVGASATVAATIVLATLAGRVGMAVAVAAGLLVVALGRAAVKAPDGAVAATRVLVGAVVIGVALGSMVLLTARSSEAMLFLLACVAAYDTGAYLVGSGATSWWEGPVAGAAAVIPITLFAIALAAVPGMDAGVLGTLAAGLAPLGTGVAGRMLGPGATLASAPTLRRIDSLLITAPVCVVLVLTAMPW